MRCLTLLLVLLGLGAQAASSHPLGEAPGRLVALGDRDIHLLCSGHGGPTAIVDVGLGATSLEWDGVRERIATHQQICVFERAGYGWSSLGPWPRTAARNVEDLREVQRLAGLQPPYVLVGHSYGGFDMQLFARLYPHLVAALVLVDSSHPEQAERFEAPPYNTRIAPSTSWGIVQLGAQPAPHPGLSPAARALSQFQRENWRPRRTISGELLGFRDTEAELRSAPPLAPLPLVVLSRGKRMWAEGRQGDLLEHLWREMQQELAAQSPHAIHLVARDSGHQIHLEQPDVVVYAIAMATASRRGPGLDQRASRSNLAAWAAEVDGRVEVLSDGLDLGPRGRLAGTPAGPRQ